MNSDCLYHVRRCPSSLYSRVSISRVNINDQWDFNSEQWYQMWIYFMSLQQKSYVKTSGFRPLCPNSQYLWFILHSQIPVNDHNNLTQDQYDDSYWFVYLVPGVGQVSGKWVGYMRTTVRADVFYTIYSLSPFEILLIFNFSTNNKLSRDANQLSLDDNELTILSTSQDMN